MLIALFASLSSFVYYASP